MKAKNNIKVEVEKAGLTISKLNKFLAASPDGIVYESVTGSTTQITGLIEIKNVLYRKELTFTEAAKSVKGFCLQLISSNSELTLKKNHNHYYQCQGLLNVCDLPWIDFVVRTTNPYEIHIERINKDTDFWTTHMLPKLKAFYFKALLPELASPRLNKYPGIREPGNWFDVVDKQKKNTVYQGKRGKKRQAQESQSDEAELSGKAGSSKVNVGTSIKGTTRKRSCTKFLGRRISHEWIEEDHSSKWYLGTVNSIINGKDGDAKATYEVLYDGDEEPHEVDHLMEDYRSGSLRLADI